MRALQIGTVGIALAVPSVVGAHPIHRRHHHCEDSERVLGRRTCGRFGDWSYVTRLPPITLGWLVQARSLALPASDTQGSATLAREQSPLVPDAMKTVGPGVRITVGVAPRFYVGTEISGGVTAGWLGGYGTIVGVFGGQHRIDRTTFAVELAAGALFADLSPRDSGWRADLDLRLRVDRWISPWWTLGGFVGLDPFVHDYSAGALFAFRFRAFDGGRS